MTAFRNPPDRPERRAASLKAGFVAAIALGLPTSGLADDAPKPVPANEIRAVAKIEDYAPPEEFVTANGIKTHVIAKGPESGRPIVFVHGFGSSTHTWRFNLEPLAAKGFRVVALDVKGFGLTAKPKDGQYHLPAYADHLLAVLETLKLDRPILVGNSMGGAIVARVGLLRPERVGAVVLVDAAPVDFSTKGAARRSLKLPNEPKPENAAGRPPSELTKKLRAVLARSLITKRAVESGLRSAYVDQKFVDEQAVEIYFRALRIDGAAEALAAMADPPPLPKVELPALKTLKVPALIVWGRHDRVLPVRLADDFARELPRARKVVFEKSGHMPHEEEADAFNALLSEFAASIPSLTP